MQRALAPGEGHGARGGDRGSAPTSGMIGAALLAATRPAESGRARSRAAVRTLSGRLVVCPTPIGNLEDVTLRVLAALREADVVACEDTRRTRVLLERYGVQATLVSYHEHNERERAPELVGRMVDGAVVALVSDAGMPLVSDPGYVLVAGCIAAGLEVEVLPGPSAAICRAGGERAAGRRAGTSPGSSRASAGALEALLRGGGDARGVRVAAPRRRLAGGARRARPGAAGRGLPRAHEAARGDRARGGGRAGRALRGRAAARRGRARHRRRPAADGRRPGRRSTRSGA